MPRYIDADAYIKYCDEKWILLNVDAVREQPTADVVERKDLISFLYRMVADLNKEMDECLERGESTSRFYLKAKRSMVEHLISIFEETGDDKIH